MVVLPMHGCASSGEITGSQPKFAAMLAFTQVYERTGCSIIKAVSAEEVSGRGVHQKVSILEEHASHAGLVDYSQQD